MRLNELTKADDFELVDVELEVKTVAKIKKLMKKRGMRFPEDIILLVREVAQPDEGECSGLEKALPDGHTGCRKSAVQKSRATARRVRASR